ncbi:glycosyltransferase family 34 protein [Teratosphaeria destructans]|uniref:Glycosyltransferase family 34 protein n=1 Tax=Teratosphaeria destructans TaxID=418781 RepID=A0A9W7SQK6_9PEZI|nr:glycosyltransferase family 34 protein [Teratosphaeria destructans]
MSGRRGGNRIRGPQSALTDFLAANNISAAQIRDDYERRRRQADQDAADNGEGPSTAQPQQEDDEALAAAAQAEEDEKAAKTKKRKRTEEETIDKIKKSKKSKKAPPKGKKRNSDDEDDDEDDDNDMGMYKKSRPLPGQLEHCDICNKRFTVTPYSKAGPDGGLLCTPCGKELAKDQKKEERAATSKPAGRKRRKVESERLDGIVNGGAKSLVQMCLNKVAQHHDDVEELGDLPGRLVDRLSQIFSKKRVMKPKTLPLFLRPDLDAVVVHDAAYLEIENYDQVFAVVPNMRKLVMGNACQFKDAAIDYMLERCHKLHHIQLYAANLVSDDGWQRLFGGLGERLQVLKLKWLDAAFDDESVRELVANCPNLDRLKLELCRRITEDSIYSIMELEKLEHLSLQVNSAVTSDALAQLISRRGGRLRTLSLRKFLDADDTVLQAIHTSCAQLSKLRFSENDTATDAGYTALFTNWSNPPLTFVDVNSTRDVDNSNPHGPSEDEGGPIGLASKGFKALMDHSGPALKHLDIASCRHIELGAFLDVFNGAHTYPALQYINVSFCNKIDTSVIAGIFQSCPALKKLVAFGCFDVQDVIVPRNIALIGVPRAQDAIEQFGTGMEVDEALGRMIEVGA